MPCTPGIAIPANAHFGGDQRPGPGSGHRRRHSRRRRPSGQLRTDALSPTRRVCNAVGNNLYLETPASGSPQSGVPGSTGYGTIQQGFLETSNVNAVDEITSLITAQRAYEMNSKVITAADEMLQDTVASGSLMTMLLRLFIFATALLMAYPAFADTGMRVVVPATTSRAARRLSDADLAYSAPFPRPT